LSLKTGFLAQDISIGSMIDQVDFSSTLPGTHRITFPASVVFNMDNPGNNPDPNDPFVKDGPFHMAQSTTRQTYVAVDRVTLTPQWSILGGAAYAGIKDKIYEEGDPYSLAYTYDKGRVSPSVALTFKPVPAISTYLSYNEALEEGPVAPDDAANAGEKMSPYLGHQVELGAKTLLGKFRVNAALFRLDKANDYIDPVTNIFSEDGREVHMGGELSFSGKITDDFTLLGGFSGLQAKITKTNTDEIKDKSPQAVPEAIARLYGEYALPPVAGLVVLGGLSYTGKEWVDDINTLSIPRVITGDAGARYSRTVLKKEMTLRLNVSNVSGANYWTTKGGSMLYLGSPRTFSFSAAIGF
jgi:iron complex outermembrane recepter protein